MPSRIPSGRKALSRERGAALLTAMVAVAVLTAVAVDLAYSTRVSLQIAANARDELRAHYLARSGVQMGRLVLSFQQTLDKTLGQAQGGIPRVQLWNLVPVDQDLTSALFPAPAGDGKGPASTSPSLFDTVEKRSKTSSAGASGGSAAGSAAAPSRPAAVASRTPEIGPTFDARIDDEARKVSAQLTAFNSAGELILRARVQALYQLVCDSRWDPLFDREDEHGIRYTRESVIQNLRDWVNEEEGASTLVPGPGTTNAQCGLVVNQPPFAKNFGDKNQPYDRGDDRYKTKNRPMDSLDELYLVAGVGDAFMAAFGDSLTAYVNRYDKQNINVLREDELVTLARVVATPGQLVLLSDPEFASRLQKAIMLQTAGGVLSLSVEGFSNALKAAGLQVNDALLTGKQSPFTDRSSVFRIRATGKVGAVRSGIDAVVRFDDHRFPGDQIAAPGRIVHWREE